jgi:hypothetical protein
MQPSTSEPLEIKLKRAQALAEQLLISVRNVAANLADERELSIDIARYLIGLSGTEHVRQALEGKPVTPPLAPTAENVTPSVTPTTIEYYECALCFEEPEYFLWVRRETGKKILLCKDCREWLRLSFSEMQPSDNVTNDVTQDDDSPDALVWKHIGGRVYEAKVGRDAVYTIMPRTEGRSGGFGLSSGYSVMYWPTGVGIDAPRGVGVAEAVEEAKAIAQMDHDEGRGGKE